MTVDSTLDALRASALVTRTAFGAGEMVWRTWGEGRPLVLLHGGGGSWEHWFRNIEVLARHRQVWCADMPSFGDSDTAPAPGDVTDIADATADCLDRLFPMPQRVDIAGFSFGGMIGTVIAHRRPGRVGQLIIVGAASLGIPRTHLPLKVWRKSSDPTERLAMHRENLHILMLAAKTADPQVVALHARNVERARYNGRRAALGTLVRDILADIDVTRFGAIYGALDVTADGNMVLLESVIRERQPGVRLVVIPQVGHWVQFEATEAFNEALLTLLDQPLSG